jgi:hypothetical protein
MSRPAAESPIRPVRQRWSMPVSVQPRAAISCEVVDAVGKRPVRRSPLGSHVAPRRRYQVAIVAPQGPLAPAAVRLLCGGGVRGESVAAQTSDDGRVTHWLDFEPRREEGWPWYFRGLFSQTDTLGVRLEYGDGRDDYEQHLPLVITPSRAWVLWSLTLTVFFYFLSQVLEQLVAASQSATLLTEYLWQSLRNPLPWIGVTIVIASLWLTATLLDRVNLARQWRRWRAAHQRDLAELDASCDGR